MNFRYFWQDNSCCKDGDIKMSLLEVALTSFFSLIPHLIQQHYTFTFWWVSLWEYIELVIKMWIIPVSVGLFKEINILLLWSLWYLRISHVIWVWICFWTKVPLTILIGLHLTQKVEDQTLDCHSYFTKVVTEFLRPIKKVYLATQIPPPHLYWNKFISIV